MQTDTKFAMAAAVFFSFALLGIAFELDTSEFSLGGRRMPSWFFSGAVLIAVMTFLVFLSFLREKNPVKRINNQTKLNAIRIAKQRWRVIGASIFIPGRSLFLKDNGWHESSLKIRPAIMGIAYLDLKPIDSEMRMTLPFSRGHPSLERIKRLSYLEEIELESLDSPLTCAKETDLCAYLMLKSTRGAV